MCVLDDDTGDTGGRWRACVRGGVCDEWMVGCVCVWRRRVVALVVMNDGEDDDDGSVCRRMVVMTGWCF